MWLMTKFGFYSVVQKKSGEYHIRARERRDLENLIDNGALSGVNIIETSQSDYHFRLVVDKNRIISLMDFLAHSIDYSNFKAKIHSIPDQANKPYTKIWLVLAR